MCLKMKRGKSFVKGFLYAIKGILHCIKNERNMRVHISIALIVTLFSFVYGLTALEYAVLFITIGLVILSEMFNTAIEVVINLNTTHYNNLAKIGKDVAAGAVLVSAVTSVFVGLALFLHFPKLIDTFIVIIKTPYLLIAFILLFIAGIIFLNKNNKL